jgi:hypothetical protein
MGRTGCVLVRPLPDSSHQHPNSLAMVAPVLSVLLESSLIVIPFGTSSAR